MPSKEYIKNFSIRLKNAMEYRNYTVERLSSETKISSNRIKNILKDKAIPKVKEVVTFSAYLDVTPDYLCSYSKSIERNSSIVVRDVINLDMSEENLDILRRIVSLYMFASDEYRKNLLKTFIE